tara:strand:+ start:14114 stop:14407 length:294 start_codon:yes stop_codon:yes gene_type:complete
METIVCSAKKGKEKRLEKLLETRNKLKKRNSKCKDAWVCKSVDGSPTFLVQTIFESEDAWRSVSNFIKDKLDPKDGGIESCLVGPPLVGMFFYDVEK